MCTHISKTNMEISVHLWLVLTRKYVFSTRLTYEGCNHQGVDLNKTDI